MAPNNILFLMTDEHRWDYAGYMDNPLLAGLTPNLDRLAGEGAAFAHCYSPNPLCMPARNAIHTGLHTFQSGQMNNVGDWPMDLPTFTQALQAMGYHTALTGKVHAHEAVGFDIDLTEEPWAGEIHALGFDDVVQVAGKTMAFFTDDDYTHHLADHDLLYAYREDVLQRAEVRGPRAAWPSILPDEHYVDNFIGREAVRWFEAYDGEAPFFHMVSFCSPHPSYDAYQSALERVDASRAPLPVNNDDAEAYRQMIANYAAQIHIVDENIGRILEILERRGWLDDTLIVFTADHGEMLGDSSKGGKCWWEDASVRVPLVVRYPGWTGPRLVSETVASCHDVTATMLHFAAGEDVAAELLPGCSSVSLRPFLAGEAERVREVAYSENGGQFMRPWRLVDDGRWKYVRLMDTGEELLFDKRVDPHCLTSVIDQAGNAGRVQALREQMLQTHLEHPAPKRGRAAYSPEVPHAITRERLERYAKE
jgi:choline-sulfatase